MATLARRGSGTPVTNGTPWTTVTNAVDGAVGSNPATYAVWNSTVALATAYIEVSGYNFSDTIGASDTINSVTVNIRHVESQTTRLDLVQFQPYDGATPIGTIFSATRATTARNDSTTFTVTNAQLRSANFKIRVNARRFNGTQAGTFSLDYADVTVDYTPPEPSITQAAYQWFEEGTESGAVPYVGQDTAVTGDITNGDATGTLRIRLQSTTAVAVPATDDFQLQYEKNTSGTWINVSAVTSNVATYDSPNLTNAAATTNRLTGGTGSFVAGKISEDSLMDDLGWAGNNFTELVYALKVKAADLADGNTLRFRILRNGVTTGLTYTQTPTINVIRTSQGSATVTWDETVTAEGITPVVIPIPTAGLDLWLDADDPSTFTYSSGVLVSQWRDKSATGWHFSQATVGNQPSRNGTINGRAAVDFAAARTMVASIIGSTATKNQSVFVVTHPGAISENFAIPFHTATSGSASGGYGIGIRLNSATHMGVNYAWVAHHTSASLTAPTEPNIATLIIDNQATAVGTLYKDGIAGTPTFSGNPTVPTVPARLNDQGWVGLIAEVIHYDRALSTTERQEVESYLRQKWGTPFSPSNLPGNVGWWDAADTASIVHSAGAVSQWNDKSGAGHHLTQTVAANKPMTGTRTLNGKNVLDFTEDWLDNGSFPLPFTYFIILQSDEAALGRSRRPLSGQGNTFVLHVDSSNNWYVYGAGFAYFNRTLDTELHVLTIVFNDPSTYLRYDGVQVSGPNTLGNFGSNFLTVGGQFQDTSSAWDGVIAEFVAYDQGLTAAECAEVEAYLLEKWTPLPSQEGSATVTHSWATSAAGKETPKGSATVSWTNTTAAVGKETPKGSATATWAETQAAAGKRVPKASATATWTEAPAAAGKRTPKASATATWTETPVAVGKRVPKGTTAATHTWVTAATGVTPAVGVKQGTAAASWTMTAAAVGKRTPKATATVTYTETTTAAGKRIQRGSATTTWTETTTGAGKRVPKSAPTVTWTQTLTAAGKRVPKASGSVVDTWTLTAAGTMPLVGFNDGFAIVSHQWTLTAVGRRVPKGGNAVVHTWTLAANGKKAVRGAATVVYTWTPIAVGKRQPKSAAATVFYVLTTTASGKRKPKGGQTVSYTFVLVAVGIAGRGYVTGLYNGQRVTAMMFNGEEVTDLILT